MQKPAVAEIVSDELRKESLRTLKGDAKEVRDAMRACAGILARRPRDYKRYVNAVRLQALVAGQNLNRDPNRKRATPMEIAKWTALSMRWPLLADEVRKDRGLLDRLEKWAVSGLSPGQQFAGRIVGLLSQPEFGGAMRSDPQIGTVDLDGLLMVH